MVSEHMVRVYKAVKGASRALQSVQVAQSAGVANRTARQHLKQLVDRGCVKRVDVFPGPRYSHIADDADIEAVMACL